MVCTYIVYYSKTLKRFSTKETVQLSVDIFKPDLIQKIFFTISKSEKITTGKLEMFYKLMMTLSDIVRKSELVRIARLPVWEEQSTNRATITFKVDLNQYDLGPDILTDDEISVVYYAKLEMEFKCGETHFVPMVGYTFLIKHHSDHLLRLSAMDVYHY